jgi:hypothetical protein
MKNISFDASQAFNANKNFKNTNTVVSNVLNETNLYLFGNNIAGKDKTGFYIDSCGWFTNTTKERLNALIGVSIQQKKGIWYLNGNVWNGQKIYIS